MTIAKVKRVKIRVLELNEDSAGVCTNVPVSLGIGSPVAGTDYHLGVMIYQDKKKAKRIDMVSANFSDEEGAAGQEGNVQLRIDLSDGNNFKKPYVTTSPYDESQTVLHCVEVQPTDDPASLIVKFFEPKQDESIAYPTLYFHTEYGVIDPGVSVHRIPPQ